MDHIQIEFVFLAALGAFFHIFLRRRVDFLTASFFGILLYFMPAFTGYVLDPYNPHLGPYVPLVAETYWVFVLALLGNILFSILYRPSSDTTEPIVTDPWFDAVLSIATVVAFFFALGEAGTALLDPDKNNVLLSQGRFWILFSALSQICAFVGAVSRRILPMICGFGAIAFSMFVGDRSALAITGVSIILYYISVLGIRRIFSLRMIFVASFFIIIVFTYKQIYVDIKYGNFDVAMRKIFDPSTYMVAFGGSEPFITQSILNTVLVYDYRIPMESLFSALVAVVPFLSEVVYIPSSLIGFNFQDIIFPGLEYGLASNIYANFYAVMGYYGIVFWIIVHNILMVWASRASMTWSGYKRIPLMLCGSLFSFYVIRSDIVYNITSLNRFIYSFIAIYILYYILSGLFRSGDGRSGRHENPNTASYNRT